MRSVKRTKKASCASSSFQAVVPTSPFAARRSAPAIERRSPPFGRARLPAVPDTRRRNVRTVGSDIGVDDDTNGLGSVQFQVVADGTTIFTSGTLLGTSAVQSISLNVAGVNQLQLRVNVATNNKNDDHADWANARLIPVAAQTLSLSGAPPAGGASTTSTASKTAAPAATSPATPTSVPLTLASLRKAQPKKPDNTNPAPIAKAKLLSGLGVSDELASLLAKDLIQKLQKKL